jgi:REP element-mobilizing transposase RayT
MARPLRIEYEGAHYHITARGNDKSLVFREDGDCLKFVDILSNLPLRFSLVIHGYILMGNHYHLLVETPKANLAKAMHYLNTSYSGYFNSKYNRSGHLFQGRYKGLLIEKERYLLAVSRYIHLNPVRSGRSKKAEDYPWSSYPQYVGKTKKVKWLNSDWILNQFSKNRVGARRRYRGFVEEGIISSENPLKDLKSGVLGSDSFIDQVMSMTAIENHREIPESRTLKKIQHTHIMRVVESKFGIREEDILNLRKRDNMPRKISLYLIRRLTDMSNEDISFLFGIGYTAVSQAVSRLKRELEKNKSLSRVVQSLEQELLS